ncbi:LysE family transporter [Paenarthrobacter sp. GOM3]|uniref:LysE family translocator n=1 Tax=Paenarthrobacter sp. GOM3 TaxID=2782567 RepID=UPI001BA460DF|nr:LysE family transporter [Paenarthrobacter sp. GOM3]WOH19337.1 LysE family transporter [Paenarthrobacter sp. GOM3]
MASLAVGRPFRAALPAIFGISIGFLALLALTNTGIGSLIQSVPAISFSLKVVGAGYLVYLAWKIFSSDPSTPSASLSAAGFWKLGALQVVNPKAWLMALTASATYPATFGGGIQGLVLMGVLFTAVNLISNSAWALLGQGGSRLIRTTKGLRNLNRVFGVLLLLSVVMLFL